MQNTYQKSLESALRIIRLEGDPLNETKNEILYSLAWMTENEIVVESEVALGALGPHTVGFGDIADEICQNFGRTKTLSKDERSVLEYFLSLFIHSPSHLLATTK